MKKPFRKISQTFLEDIWDGDLFQKRCKFLFVTFLIKAFMAVVFLCILRSISQQPFYQTQPSFEMSHWRMSKYRLPIENFTKHKQVLNRK